MLRIPHCLDNRYSDDDGIVSLELRPPFTPGRFLVLISVGSIASPGVIVLLEELGRQKLRGLSPRANYTDRATAACWRI
jgi:hypothetical protein